MKAKQDIKDKLDKMRHYFNGLKTCDIDQTRGHLIKESRKSVCLFCHLAVCFDLTQYDENIEEVTYDFSRSFENSDEWEDFRELIYTSIINEKEFDNLKHKTIDKPKPDDVYCVVRDYYMSKIREEGLGLGDFLFNAVKDRLKILKNKRYGWEF